MATYIEGLKDLSLERIAQGCERALKEVDRMPTVAHIRERAKIPELDLSVQLTADRMYEKTLNWVRWSYSPDFKGSREELPPVCEYALRHAGGEEVFISTEPETKSITQHKFCSIYKEIYSALQEKGINTRAGARQFLEEMRKDAIVKSFQVPEKTS